MTHIKTDLALAIKSVEALQTPIDMIIGYTELGSNVQQRAIILSAALQSAIKNLRDIHKELYLSGKNL